MAQFQEIILLLQITTMNLALFSGGIFAGATVYVSLAECPPRAGLTLEDLLTLSRIVSRRAHALMSSMAASTAVTASAAAVVGGGVPWMAGAAIHIVTAYYLLKHGKDWQQRLEVVHWDASDEGRAAAMLLMKQRALLHAALGFAGLVSLYIFVVSR